jgi:hypothetical protein
MKKFTFKKKMIAGAAAAALVLGAGGAAFAYFTSTGAGSGNASVGSATNWTVSVTSDTSNTLYPGSGTETLSYTITNASTTAAQALNAVTATVADSGGCLGTWFSAVASAPTPAIHTSIAPGGTATGTVVVSLNDSGTNQDACQGITTVPVTVHAS